MPSTSPQPSALSPHSLSPRFVLVAGESSGDLLGARLIESLRVRFADASFSGVGGPQMAAAGMDLWYPAERLSVMGLVEVLPRLPALLALRRDVYKRTLQQSPDVFIGIDAPDFNLGLERRLKQHGIRTAHYVSPSVWAWREERIRRIKDLLSHTDYKLSTIADQVGIAHAEYLNVMFKEVVGMTPGAYRKKFGDRMLANGAAVGQ